MQSSGWGGAGRSHEAAAGGAGCMRASDAVLGVIERHQARKQKTRGDDTP